MMTVKEFLNDVRRQHARVEACKERLKEIEYEVISLKSPQYSRYHRQRRHDSQRQHSRRQRHPSQSRKQHPHPLF